MMVTRERGTYVGELRAVVQNAVAGGEGKPPATRSGPHRDRREVERASRGGKIGEELQDEDPVSRILCHGGCVNSGEARGEQPDRPARRLRSSPDQPVRRGSYGEPFIAVRGTGIVRLREGFAGRALRPDRRGGRRTGDLHRRSGQAGGGRPRDRQHFASGRPLPSLTERPHRRRGVGLRRRAECDERIWVDGRFRQAHRGLEGLDFEEQPTVEGRAGPSRQPESQAGRGVREVLPGAEAKALAQPNLPEERP